MSNYFEFNIVSYETTNDWSDELANEILKRKTLTSANKILNIQRKTNKSIINDAFTNNLDFTVIILESAKQHHEFNSVLKINLKLPKKFRFLFIYGSLEMPNMLKGKIHFSYQSMLTSCPGGNQICLYSAERFTKLACREHIILVNRFSSHTRRWATRRFFPTLENFNGCQIVVQIMNFLMPDTHFKNSSDGLIVSGAFVDMITAISTQLNFTILYSPYDRESDSYWYPNLTKDISLTGSNIHLVITNSEWELPWLSFPFMSEPEGFFIPPGHLYTPLEKLFLPFDEDTWIWLIVFLLTGVLVIFIVSYSPKHIKNFVFGRYVRHPMFNMLRAIFGIGQIKLPSRNFARYILMMFFIFCMVMRTAYQGKMYEFMQKDIRKPVAQTIQELIDKNFTFYVGRGYAEVLSNFDIFKGANIEDNHLLEFESTLMDLKENPNAKIAQHTTLDNHYGHNTFSGYLHVLKETYQTSNVGWLFQHGHPLYFPLNEVIKKVFEGGLLEYWLYQPTANLQKKMSAEFPKSFRGPQVFTMSHLWIGFLIWLECLAVCFAVFVFEVIEARVSRRLELLIREREWFEE